MILAKVVDGTLVKVKGDPDNPYTAGGLCVKTQSYVDWTYSEERILYPLRRTGTKGPGCTFERISWDDAIDEITTKWKDIIDQDGGEAITWSRYQGNQGSLNRRVLEPLFFKMGATYCEGSMCNNGYVYSLPYTTAGVPVMAAEDIANKSLYVSWAHNPSATTLHTMKFVKQMNKKGGKIIVVNPVATPETVWADLYVQLKPGTDLAFALGVGKYLIDHDMYAPEWIEQWAQGFDDYKAECDQWPASKVAELCGIPEEQVAQFAELFWEHRANACLKTGLCLGRRLTGGMSHISIKCLSGLVGHPEMYFNMTSSGRSCRWRATTARSRRAWRRAPRPRCRSARTASSCTIRRSASGASCARWPAPTTLRKSTNSRASWSNATCALRDRTAATPRRACSRVR
jgi:anaerobic selenocysteine-containing dehydrogenase